MKRNPSFGISADGDRDTRFTRTRHSRRKYPGQIHRCLTWAYRRVAAKLRNLVTAFTELEAIVQVIETFSILYLQAFIDEMDHIESSVPFSCYHIICRLFPE